MYLPVVTCLHLLGGSLCLKDSSHQGLTLGVPLVSRVLTGPLWARCRFKTLCILLRVYIRVTSP